MYVNNLGQASNQKDQLISTIINQLWDKIKGLGFGSADFGAGDFIRIEIGDFLPHDIEGYIIGYAAQRLNEKIKDMADVKSIDNVRQVSNTVVSELYSYISGEILQLIFDPSELESAKLSGPNDWLSENGARIFGLWIVQSPLASAYVIKKLSTMLENLILDGLKTVGVQLDSSMATGGSGISLSDRVSSYIEQLVMSISIVNASAAYQQLEPQLKDWFIRNVGYPNLPQYAGLYASIAIRLSQKIKEHQTYMTKVATSIQQATNIKPTFVSAGIKKTTGAGAGAMSQSMMLALGAGAILLFATLRRK